MTELTQRIAALSPAQREMLLRELAREGAAAPAPDLSLPPLVARPDESFEPFPLTEVQEVYWAGRSGLFDLGTPGVNVYLEYELPGAEPYLDLLERSLRRLCELHPMLRLVMLPDGRQQIREEIPPVRIERADLRNLPPDEVDDAIAAAQERFRYQPGTPGQWPLFGFLAQLLDGARDGARIRLHVWFDAWLIDGMSRNHLMADLQHIVSDPDAPLRQLPCTYRDYALSWEAIRNSEAWRRARAWWLERVPDLPPPPELPLAVALGPHVPARFVHRVAPLLAPAAWTRFQAHAAKRSLTASPALITAFVEMIRTWSRHPRFSFSLEGTWYPPVHPGLSEIVGNFNTIYIAVAGEPRGTFAERARRMQEQVTDILDHRAFSGFQVLREIRRQRGGGTRAQMPINFNNLVDHPGAEPPSDLSDPSDHPSDHPSDRPDPSDAALPQRSAPRELDLGINPPQILLMPSVYEDDDGALSCKLQAVEEVFPPGLVQDLWGAYTGLLERLADDETLWESAELRLTPAAQLERRASSRLPADAVQLPAGLAAAPHTLHVLDAELQPRPDWVPGELWIGGPGLARGSWRDGHDEEAAAGRFLTHPRTGERLFRAGHLARFLPGGAIEILGREDDAIAQRETDELPLTQPPDPLEDEIGRLSGAILGTAPLGPGDDFFAHGGTSFTAVLLLTRVRERQGDERDLTGFLYDATPRHLARLVRSGPLRRAPAPAATPAPRRALLPPITGMKAFLVLWVGQFLSGFGSGLGSFALGVWLFEKSGSTTQFAMVGFFVISLSLVIAPIAGVLADRMDRRRLIALGDCCAAVMTLLMAAGLWTGRMQPWHVFFIAPLMSAFSALQGPAMVALVSSLVPRAQLARATGLSQMIGSLSSIVCPLAAGGLIGLIGYHGVILIDFSTFLIAITTIFLIRVPRPKPVGPAEGKRTFQRDLLFGFSYLRERPGLLGLLGLFAFTNFAMGIVQVLLTPLLLGFATPLDLGTVNSAGAVGIFLGAAVLGAWGGPRLRVRGIFWFMILQGLILLLGGLRPNIPLIAGAAFVFMLASPIVGGCNQAIWQSKVELGAQGRVMAARILVAGVSMPLAYLLAGPLADRVFEPLLAPGGALAGSVGRLIGVGDGRGVGFLFMVLGIFIILTICLSFLNPRLRRVETELPDARPSDDALRSEEPKGERT